MNQPFLPLFILGTLLAFFPGVLSAQTPVELSERVGMEIDSVEREYFGLFPGYGERFVSASFSALDSNMYRATVTHVLPDGSRRDSTRVLGNLLFQILRQYVEGFEHAQVGRSIAIWGANNGFVRVSGLKHPYADFTVVGSAGGGYRYKVLSVLDSGLLFIRESNGYMWRDPLESVSYMPFSEMLGVYERPSSEGVKSGLITGGLAGLGAGTLVYFMTKSPLLSFNLWGWSTVLGGAVGETRSTDERFVDRKRILELMEYQPIAGERIPPELRGRREEVESRNDAFPSNESVDIENYVIDFDEPNLAFGIQLGQIYNEVKVFDPERSKYYGRGIAFPEPMVANPLSLRAFARIALDPSMRFTLNGEYDIGTNDNVDENWLSGTTVRASIDFITIRRDATHRVGEFSWGLGVGMHNIGIREQVRPFADVDTFEIDYPNKTTAFSISLPLQTQLFLSENLSLVSTLEPAFVLETSFDELKIARDGLSAAVVISETGLANHLRIAFYTGVAYHL